MHPSDDAGHELTSAIMELVGGEINHDEKADSKESKLAEDNFGICDACGSRSDDLFIISTPTLAGIVICKSCREKKEEKVMKKRLYSRLSQYAPHDGSDKFYGGHLNLFGIPISIEWSSQGYWEFYSPDALTSDDISGALEDLDRALSVNDSILVFGDEDSRTFAEIENLSNFKSGKEFFWTEDGRKWRLGALSISGSGLEQTISIEVSGTGKPIPTGVVMQFDNHETVYVYVNGTSK